VLEESLPKLGLKPDGAAGVLSSLVAGADGVKPNPVATLAVLDGSAIGFSFVLGANKFVDDCVAGADGLLPIALANMFDVAVAVGLGFCGVGLAGVSIARARLVGEGSRTSGLSLSTLRLVDKLDS